MSVTQFVTQFVVVAVLPLALAASAPAATRYVHTSVGRAAPISRTVVGVAVPRRTVVVRPVRPAIVVGPRGWRAVPPRAFVARPIVVVPIAYRVRPVVRRPAITPRVHVRVSVRYR